MAAGSTQPVSVDPILASETPASVQGWPTKDDWAPHRSAIKRLYQDEDKKLKEVMEIMKREKGLKATPKMYKSKITAWGLDKKMKGNEVRAIVRMRRKRWAVGKASAFRIRGQVQDFDKVKSHLKRKGLTLDDVPSESDSPVPSLECYTPEPQAQGPSCSAMDNALTPWNGQHMFRTPSPRLISSPDFFRISEQVLKDIHIYFTESFASAKWAADGPRLVKVACSTPSKKKSLSEIPWPQTMFWTAALFNAGGAANAAKGGHYLQQAFRQCEDTIKAENPSLIFHLLEVLDEFEATYKRPEMVTILLRHIHSLASIFLGMKHPITSIGRQLSFLDTWTNISGVAWNVVRDMCERFLGPDHIHTKKLQLDVFTRFSGRNDMSFAETQLRDFLFRLRQSSNPESFLRFRAQYLLARVLVQQGRLGVHGAEAERLALESARWALGDPRYMVEPREPNLGATSLRLLAWLQEYRGAILLAKETMRYNCERCITYFGRENPATQTAITEYEAFLVRYGMSWGSNVGP